MHDVNNTTELVIRKLTEGYVPLTEDDRGTIRSYIASNQNKIPTISELRNYRADSHLGAMYAFLYKKSGITYLLEVISDEDKQKSIKEKADKYIYMYRKWYKEFLIENFQEFLAFNAFIYDSSKCQFGKENCCDYETKARSWKAALNNSTLMKYLLVNDKVSFEKLCASQGNYCIGNVSLMLKKARMEVESYVRKQGKKGFVIPDIVNSSDEKVLQCQPDTLMQLAAVTLAIKENLIDIDFSKPASYAECIKKDEEGGCDYHMLR